MEQYFSYEDLKEEYFSAMYGEAWKEVVEYLEAFISVFNPAIISMPLEKD